MVQLGWIGCKVKKSLEAYRHWASLAKIEGLFEAFLLILVQLGWIGCTVKQSFEALGFTGHWPLATGATRDDLL